jgi:hypothetical protein
MPWPNAGLQYTRPEPTVICECSGVRISICSGLEASHQRMAHSLKEEIRIEMAAQPPLPLSEFQWRIDACKDLLSTATLAICQVDELRLQPAGDDGAPAMALGTWHAVPIFTDPSSRSWPEMLFSANDIRDRIQEVFSTWLQNARALNVVRSLYLSAVYGKAFLELKLIYLTQAAEAYHRRCYDGLYMDEVEFAARVSQPLTEGIPPGLDSSLRQSLQNRLKYGNEYSFRKRLGVLLAEHEAALSSIVPEPRGWTGIITDHRNAFTHNPVVDDQPHSIDHEEIIRCNYVLQTLLEMCFLKSAGVTAEQTKTLAARCARYQGIRQRFFQSRRG